jgi:Tfp pilus tip-associated adhesin PilY1
MPINKSFIDPTAAKNKAGSSAILTFLHGDRSQAKPVGTPHQRYNVLGDISHSKLGSGD